jgi:hypothetical protein
VKAIEPIDAVGVLSSAYGGVMEAVAGLDEDSGWQPTRCTGWCVRDLLFHLYTDARRGLAALCTPVGAGTPVDRDWASYWTDWQDTADPDQHGLRMVRISASAFSSLAALRDVHAQTARATVAVAHAVDPRSHASTQGHVLTAADLMITLAVEATVHHMDLVVAVDRPGPGTGASGAQRRGSSRRYVATAGLGRHHRGPRRHRSAGTDTSTASLARQHRRSTPSVPLS